MPEVKELSRLTPARVILDVALNWGLILLAWSLAYRFGNWWAWGLAGVAVGNRFYSLFIIAHDGLHRRLFPSREVNDRFNDLFILGAIGAITRINKRNHLAHHRHLSNPDDPDRHRHGCFNKSDHPELSLYLVGLASIVPSVRAVFGGGPRKKPKERYSRADIVILLGWQLVLAGGLTFYFGAAGFPLLWVLPVYGFVFLADNFRSFAEHSHPEADELADEHRLITYLAPRWELEFVAPMNMNYHAAHHLWPSIPYYNLPKADRLMRARNRSPELEWRESYLEYLSLYWSRLPLSECKKS